MRRASRLTSTELVVMEEPSAIDLPWKTTTGFLKESLKSLPSTPNTAETLPSLTDSRCNSRKSAITLWNTKVNLNTDPAQQPFSSVVYKTDLS